MILRFSFKALFFLSLIIFQSGIIYASKNGDVAEQILEAPAWNYYEYEKGADLKVVESIRLLAELSDDDCRAVVEKIMLTHDKSPTRNKWFKVMIINRLIFNIPDNFKRKDFGSIAGWGFPTAMEYNDVPLMWPLVKRDGCFRIASRSMGYSGADYDGLSEFDAFLGKFKRRPKDGVEAKNW
jgi:hypothetical protein